ncbi:acetoin utilization AcuB family protein [Bacillus sp. CMF21]|uniref:acetoin utilization AcuB family protein n=1 Tax=Metabacillus dongyingensis TaxID=2874282 RepID=UPI001CBD44E8|nr:acetoin utilization AcuB family protein [Metabacillus dongyingensis]UAL51350.1 acetoin utilization AcuB family protein [Metabacillus dongyingensis]UOK57282.1 acetoin utilization AcuB family protein [Bacillus sp. OVS6]USK27652.1 acetoin utilization AcuB family protein [Bacillus sp. CMF21]
MIVEQIMKKDIVTLTPDATIAEAIKKMAEYRIRHIPIVAENDLLAGIVSDRDIKDASPSIFHLSENKEALNKPLKSIMKTDAITGHPLDFVEEISSIFYEHKIGCLPIIKHGKLVGIVTETDLLHTFVQLTGANQPGSQIEVKVPNVTGMLSEVSDVFRKSKVNIASVLVYPDKDERFKVLVFRVQTMNPMALIEELDKEGYTVLWPNIPGISS